MKNWYESKTLWFNAIMTVVLTAQMVSGFYDDFTVVTGMVAGFGNILLRVWFTEKGIAK